MSETYDILIAGGGTAGVLLAARLRHARPDMRIKLLEKEDAPGGRVRSCIPGKGLWSYGLNFINQDLYRFWDETLKLDPDASDLQSSQAVRQDKVGVLSASKISDIKLEDFFATKGAKNIGGLAAMRDWKHVIEVSEALRSGKRKDQAFHSIWPGNKKSPAVIVLEQMMQVLGIPDLWSVSTAHLLAKAEEFATGRYLGDWEEALMGLAERLNADGTDSFQTGCHIIGAAYDETAKEWTVSARGGQSKAKVLVVAQTPWDALSWLPKTYWPAGLLQLAVKAKPVSCVVLSEVLGDAAASSLKDLPSVVLVPAENCHVIISPQGEVCYQTTIDYEISMQAPDVVKAVKRLKRARRKFITAVPEMTGSGEHLSLLPVAWSQPSAFNDRRLCEKTEDRFINSEKLLFVGDAYGRGYTGDNNLIRSVLNTYGRLTGEKVVVEEAADVIAAEDTDQEHDERTDN